jgi:hypothetical protein
VITRQCDGCHRRTELAQRLRIVLLAPGRCLQCVGASPHPARSHWCCFCCCFPQNRPGILHFCHPLRSLQGAYPGRRQVPVWRCGGVRLPRWACRRARHSRISAFFCAVYRCVAVPARCTGAAAWGRGFAVRHRKRCRHNLRAGSHRHRSPRWGHPSPRRRIHVLSSSRWAALRPQCHLRRRPAARPQCTTTDGCTVAGSEPSLRCSWTRRRGANRLHLDTCAATATTPLQPLAPAPRPVGHAARATADVVVSICAPVCHSRRLVGG